MNRKLTAAAAAVMLTACIVLDSRFTLETTEYSARFDDLPPEFDGFRIAVLSDLHGMSFGEGNSRLIRAVSDAKPDMIAILGDMITYPSDLPAFESLLDGIEGFHFHTLCEQNSDDLVRTVAAFEQNFGQYMDGLKWINLGGGHHITRADYDVETLVHCIDYLQKKYKVQVYLEPGEAVVLNAGYLVSTVLEVMHNHKDIAILDTSAACHMPDVLEVPYRPPVYRGGEPGKKAFTYLLTGRSCLAGDVIGEYSFDVALGAGEQVVFEDMALYTMVKTNTFNGMPLPLIAIRRADGTDEVVRMFGYEEFKRRLS